MAIKYYRVKETNFLWVKGAIVTNATSEGQYKPAEEHGLWDYTEHNGNEYISARIIENNPDWFERVYPISGLRKIVYKLRDEAQAALQEQYTD